MQINNIKAIILAAGEGSRLRPHTLDRPKCLVEVEGKSLLSRQLEIMNSEGVAPILLIGGYRSDMLKSYADGLRINPDYATTNMVWSLFSAEHDLEGDILLSYGDIAYSKNVLQAVLKSKADIAVVIDRDWRLYWEQRSDNPLGDAETLRLSDAGDIVEIGQRPTSLDEIEGQYIGLMKFTARGIKSLKKVFHDAKDRGSLGGKAIEKAYMTDLLQEMINKCIPLTAVPINGGWVEIDTVEDLCNQATLARIKQIDND